jgi:YHS domain-containing protein
MAKDPVCGMTVDDESPAAITVLHDNTYYFCSEQCKQQFDKEPAKFTQGESDHVHH